MDIATQGTPPTEDSIAQRRRIAQALMMQGTDASPVQHWSQAAARAAQGLIGGYQGGEANRAASQREAFDTAQAQQQQGANRAYAEGEMGREVEQKKRLAAEAGLTPGTPEFQQYVYEIKPVGSGSPSDMPSNVREYEYFSKLPPEQQQQYITMKRAQQTLDLGDRFGVLNPTQPGQVGSEIRKNLVDAEAQKELGQSIGSQAASAGSDVDAADSALEIVDSLRNDPNRAAGTSTLSPIGNLIPKTPGFAFEQKVQQAKSGAFLTAIQQLRGMGALSNAEGQTATQAVTRMTTATRDEDFEEALKDYERLVERARRKGRNMQKERQRLLGQTGGQAAPEQTGGGVPDLKSKYGLE
jgi:hypothetical protein